MDLINQYEEDHGTISKANRETLEAKVELWRQGKVALDEQNKALEKEQERLKKNAEEQKRQKELLLEPIKNAIRDVQSLVTQTFEDIFSGNLKKARDFWDAFKKIALRTLANLASTKLFNRILPAIAGGIGITSVANASGGGQATGSGFGDIVNGVTSPFEDTIGIVTGWVLNGGY